MRVADPDHDNGAFPTMSRLDALILLKLIGVQGLSPQCPYSAEEVLKKLRFALWDVQRFVGLDLLFPQKTLGGHEKLDIGSLPSWPTGRRSTYVFRHFQMSAFTQTENVQALHANPSPDMRGAWYGVKNAMTSLGLYITQEGGDNLPFLTCHTSGVSPHILVAEVLEVKQANWPEPSEKCFTYLVNEGSTLQAAREKLQYHLRTGLQMSEVHMRTFARILASNSDLIDPDYKREMQSHWHGVSHDVAKETRISFVAPCLRLRWRALEELETGVSLAKFTSCNKCGETGKKLTCGSCKSVYYCNTSCNKADWPEHKEVCKFSKRLLTPNSGLPANKFYVPLRTYHPTILDSGFAIEQEMIRESGSPPPGECPSNEYGEKRFMLRVHMPPDYAVGAVKGQSMFVWDRRRSLCARAGPGEVLFAREQGTSEIPFDRAGHAKLMGLVRRGGVQGQVMFVWGKRVGDCVEIE
ncbi:hypothetical protein OF83DRAFT_1166299 [Amylostereum chailletii]|nr:hypothetical protein OF83DRAFT_1166299 [Amylostereum chailletii]